MSSGAPTPAGNIVLRTADAGDLRAIVRLLADDALGRARERDVDPLPGSYRAALEAIAADPNNTLLVAVGDDGRGDPVGVLQLTVIPSLTYQGRPRALIEGVRIAAAMRGHGLGRRLFAAAIELARERGCHLLQLTTDKRRPEALRFYQSLGFVASHEGMKLDLSDQAKVPL